MRQVESRANFEQYLIGQTVGYLIQYKENGNDEYFIKADQCMGWLKEWKNKKDLTIH